MKPQTQPETTAYLSFISLESTISPDAKHTRNETSSFWGDFQLQQLSRLRARDVPAGRSNNVVSCGVGFIRGLLCVRVRVCVCVCVCVCVFLCVSLPSPPPLPPPACRNIIARKTPIGVIELRLSVRGEYGVLRWPGNSQCESRRSAQFDFAKKNYFHNV